MARSASMDHQPHGDSNKSEPLKKLVLNPADIGAYMFQGAGVIMAMDIVFWPLEVATTRMQATKDVPANFSVEWRHTTLYLGVYEQMTAMIESRFPDTNNTNSATRGTAHVSTLGMCKHMYKSDGIRAFYQGFWATMWANAPGSVAFWAGYETTKKVVYNEFKACEDREQQLDRPGFFSKHMLSQKKGLILALSALNSTWLSTLLTSPFDMVRVRLQLLDGAIVEDAAQLKRGWWGMFKLIARQEGWRGFFKGLGPKFWAAFPGCVGYLFAYEVIKENLVESND
ncbi:hypothetical protein DFQ26_004977 [Actinomortierella ambigua]|nr:hypothetical protein DFQ26_004977 [Actinomortierella ambigua]